MKTPLSLIAALLLGYAAPSMAAVTINGSATNHNISTTIGSGVASTFAYTVPAGTTTLAIIEESLSGAPAAPTGVSIVSPFTAFTLVPSSFVSDGTGEQASIWYLNSPTIGAITLSITYTQSVSGGGAVFVIPLSGTSTSTTVGTVATNFSNSAVSSASLTVPTATANDLIIAGLAVDGVPTLTDGQTNLFNTTSRGSVRVVLSDSPGTSGSLSWTAFSAAALWAASGVAFLAPTSSCTNNFWSSTGAWAIPNGTTGSYWSTTGVFATPNCSTGSYWLKSGAKGST